MHLLILSYLFANTIFFVGDGMGPSIVSATRAHFYKGQLEMNMDKMPHTAIISTHSLDFQVTDSAAAASAFFCGQKFNNGNICYQAKKTPLLKLAKDKGYVVGAITSTTVDHATPASLYASVKHRDDKVKIAQNFFKSRMDFLVGGGSTSFFQQAKKQSKFQNINKTQDIPSARLPFLALLSSGHFPFLDEKEKPQLREVVKLTLEKIFKQKKKFFILIEAGRIDHALHEAKPANALLHTKQLDDIIGDVIHMLKTRKLLDTTSLIVTADHDTAGLDLSGYPTWQDSLIVDGELQKSKRDQLDYLRYVHNGKFSQHHTAVDVMLYGQGPCASKINGTMDNTQIYDILKACL